MKFQFEKDGTNFVVCGSWCLKMISSLLDSLWAVVCGPVVGLLRIVMVKAQCERKDYR